MIVRFIYFIFLLIISGCSLTSSYDLERYSLSTEEHQLIRATGTESIGVYDVTIQDKNINAVSCRIKFYQDGDQIDTLDFKFFDTSLIYDENVRLSLMRREIPDTDNLLYLVSLNSDGIQSVARQVTRDIPGNRAHGEIKLREKLNIIPDQPLILAVERYFHDPPQVHLNNEMFTDPQTLEQIIEEGDAVIYTCTFKNQERGGD
ncbi:MAG: hypothetical protein H0Z33_02815 [Bacillaceae bacterium]|nr:hypothetical protein [Bacillaceae bacterium]